MTHNQWAEIIRGFLELSLGSDMKEWPDWVDSFIYKLADYLSYRDN